MSFSFGAEGPRDDVIEKLKSETLSDDGERARDLILSFLENVPDVSATGGTTYTYAVSATGHHGGAQTTPSLSISLLCRYQPPLQ